MKTVPQINIFVVGLQLRVLIGLVLVAVCCLEPQNSLTI